MTEQEIIAQAVVDVLQDNGWEVAESISDGKLVRTSWREIPGDSGAPAGEHRRKLEVRISHTSMGFALGTKVETAVPADAVPADAVPADTVMIDGDLWVLKEDARAEEKQVERAVALMIQDRWQELKREMRSQPEPTNKPSDRPQSQSTDEASDAPTIGPGAGP